MTAPYSPKTGSLAFRSSALIKEKIHYRRFSMKVLRLYEVSHTQAHMQNDRRLVKVNSSKQIQYRKCKYKTITDFN
jgi:hypothetical protein